MVQEVTGPLALRVIEEQVPECRACPRLVEWRERVGREKRRAFRDEVYWARPVPGFGDHEARLLIVGLAPAAHGGNRTGRIFTGDRSGDWLFAALYRAGFANQPESVSRDDGLTLCDVYITASVKCAPPDNKPTRDETNNCRPFLLRELQALRNVRVILCLGGFAWQQAFRALTELGYQSSGKRPSFGHGAIANMPPFTIVGCYHPSQQNTFTGRLTHEMLDSVFERVRGLLDGPG